MSSSPRCADESDSPLGVAIVDDVEFTFTKRVPQLDASVSGSGDDLSVVGGERDAEYDGQSLI